MNRLIIRIDGIVEIISCIIVTKYQSRGPLTLRSHEFVNLKKKTSLEEKYELDQRIIIKRVYSLIV